MVNFCNFLISLYPSAFWIIIAVFVVLCCPLIIPKKTRVVAGVIIGIAAFAMMFVAWSNGFVITYAHWGSTGIIVGCIIMGVGIIPMGVLAGLFSGDWFNLVMLIVQITMFWSGFALAGKLFSSTQDKKERDINA
jgi:hypothetical protein